MKEFKWNVVIGSCMHTILCVMDENGYDIYDGDNRIARVYRKSFFHNLRGGVERDLEIDGHTVKFVCWDKYSPDIVVDGIKIGEGVSYDEARKSYKNAMFTVYTVGLAICCIMFGGIVPKIFSSSDRTLLYIVDSLLFLAGGIFCVRRLFKLR